MRSQKDFSDSTWMKLDISIIIAALLPASSALFMFCGTIGTAVQLSTLDHILIYVLYCVVACFVCAANQWLVKKPLTRILAVFSAVLYAAGWIMTAFASSAGMVYLAFGGLSGLGAGALYSISISNVLEQFSVERKSAMKILLGSGFIGSVFFSAVASLLIRAELPRFGYIGLGVVISVLAITAIMLVEHMPHKVIGTQRELPFLLLYLLNMLVCIPGIAAIILVSVFGHL